MADRKPDAVELNEVKIDPIKFALADEGFDDDWQNLTHEDVKDLQKLFDFFAAQDPDQGKERHDSGDDDYDDEDAYDDLEAGDMNAALTDGVHGNSSGGNGGSGGASKPRPRMFTTRGMSRLLQAMGVHLPFREVQIMFNSAKQNIDHGGAAAPDDFASFLARADVRGLAYEDFVMHYALATKDLSTDREVKEAFRLLDDDFDGFVELRKLVPVLEQLLGLDAPRVEALLVKARSPRPAMRNGRPVAAHNSMRVQQQQAQLTDKEWLAGGKMSYAEFVEFLQQ